nr:MAG TPA: hypothetical protein [Caudoviricetes sp.]
MTQCRGYRLRVNRSVAFLFLTKTEQSPLYAV